MINAICYWGFFMSKKKANSSYASWALIMEGVTSARVEAYRLRHLLNRTLKLVEDSTKREHLYQVGGDIIMGFPQRLHRLEETLDRTSYALSKMGESHLRERLPISHREKVDESIERALPLSPSMRRAHQNIVRIASRREFFDVLRPYYNAIKRNPKSKTVILQLIKFWFMNDLSKVPAGDEKWFAKNQVTGDSPPFVFDLKPTKPNKGYGGGHLEIGRGVQFVFTDHAVVRCALRNVSLQQAINVVRTHLMSKSQSPYDLDTSSEFFRKFNEGLSAEYEGLDIRYTVGGFRPYSYPTNAKIIDRAKITIHTVIRKGYNPERAGSLDLSDWFDPTIIGLDSWDEMDWNTVKDRK